MNPNEILIIQHIWTRWSKVSRGSHSAVRRIRLNDAYVLPKILPAARAVCHEIKCLEQDDFALFERLGAIDTASARRSFAGLDRLNWRLAGDVLKCRFLHARSAFDGEAGLDGRSVSFTVKRENSVRIIWNSRLPMSMTGNNRSSIYEAHVFAIYLGSAVAVPDFRNLEPAKVIDLARHIF